MDVADQASAVTEAFLDGARARFCRDAEILNLGVLIGPLVCRGCGEPIPDARRAAMPSADQCVDCTAEVEARRPSLGAAA